MEDGTGSARERRGGGLGVTILVAAIVSAFVATFTGGGIALLVQFGADATVADEDDVDLAAWDDDPSPEVVEGAVDAEIDAAFDGDATETLYSFELPEDAIAVSVDLDGGDVDVDLDIAFGKHAALEEEWLDSAHGADGRESLFVGRADVPAFGREPLMVRVSRYEADQERAPYVLSVTVARHVIDSRLVAGASVSATLGPDSSHRRAYEVLLPEGVDVVRVDLTDVRQNLDLAAHPGPLHDVNVAAVVAESALARESLLISRRELRLGRGDQILQLVVSDLAQTQRDIPFTLHVTAGDAVPDAVRGMPAPPTSATPSERLMHAVVSVIGPDGEGSGVIVGTDGLVLTAAHVVEGADPESDDVVIAISLDPTHEPYELLRGRVTHRDEHRDVALVRITTTFAGDALPEGWRLPGVEVRPAPRAAPGEPVHVLGYPMLHGSGDRSEITWTTGAVSGFERHEGHLTVRFDAEIAGGSSGGAILDSEHRLLAIVTSGHGDMSGFSATGVGLPIESFPEGWADLLR